MTGKHVTVLMGGWSSERSVSLSSGTACADILEAQGYNVVRVDVDDRIVSVLEELRPTTVFNALHGPFGEDGCIQGILEYLKIPYTHSGVMASALAMDKGRAKIIAASAGVSVAPSCVMSRFSLGAEHPMKPPYVIKPIREGSSFGVVIVGSDETIPPHDIMSNEWVYDDEIMVEKYVPGRELTCAVLGDEVLDVCEIVPKECFQFYDYDSKYKSGGSLHICPAKLSSNIYQNVQRMSLAAHQAIGCRGVSRSDFRFNEETGELIWLEINTQPGMTSTSLVPDIAKASGRTYGDIVKWIVEDASCMR
ncbi:D-alanine-D-alanine ligase [Bartonella bacilliformis str. Heidi Mejia]|uniref:D-alanine--D-alanine ligase n=1 Tax=Bartonella bacilliformis TaxID=774 RepID=UPI00044E5999|nr:D-alanine--D-alanine ligase [Bartonella bacilliformis]EYS92626.1 D-alanine-D-alanine ligase [Bartonella bacilliformis str. Heidi Mejia]KEG16963.1 D-alanine-D-alanine ligase [Bartonella bacilliformis Cond044]KEG19083.1 D-alanine-D-alanine ligase [Bartonella bacilliformis Hosp800-02]KEG22284.1 D-alanine-D-alanine ligase [Bartonella bacilliformis VAB9028]KEG24540.1 D-alanine-D-alanine ligase [Bartonella bacilliformis CAR600-02]